MGNLRAKRPSPEVPEKIVQRPGFEPATSGLRVSVITSTLLALRDKMCFGDPMGGLFVRKRSRRLAGRFDDDRKSSADEKEPVKMEHTAGFVCF